MPSPWPASSSPSSPTSTSRPTPAKGTTTERYANELLLVLCHHPGLHLLRPLRELLLQGLHQQKEQRRKGMPLSFYSFYAITLACIFFALFANFYFKAYTSKRNNDGKVCH